VHKPAGCGSSCVILGQAAKAERDAELVATAEQGLEEAD
jgi:hypothetical protein